MEQKKAKKLDLQSKLLIVAAVVIAALICYMCIEKVIDINNVKAYEAKIVELQQTIGKLYQDFYLGTDEAGEADETDGSDVADDDYWYTAWSECRDELDSLYYADEDITDTIAKLLFIRGVHIIWAQNISDLSKYPIADPRVTTEIDGQVYVKRDVLYSDVVKEYSRIFTGDLLEERLNQNFAEIDGYLYVVAGGGDLGESVVNVEVTKVSESNGEFTYRVKYDLQATGGNISQENNTCTMVIKSVGNGYAISSLEFDEPEEETPEQDVTEQDTTAQGNTEQGTPAQDNSEQNDAEQDNTEQDNAEQSGAEQNDAEQDNTEPTDAE